MPRANKTARISTEGYYPPCSLCEPMEPYDEESQDQGNAPLAPTPTPEPLQEEPEDEEDVEVIVVEDDDDEEDAAQGDGERS